MYLFLVRGKFGGRVSTFIGEYEVHIMRSTDTGQTQSHLLLDVCNGSRLIRGAILLEGFLLGAVADVCRAPNPGDVGGGRGPASWRVRNCDTRCRHELITYQPPNTPTRMPRVTV